jgi:hypothetical protein
MARGSHNLGAVPEGLGVVPWHLFFEIYSFM